mmetsp:Transcript_12418/g.17727  ORF Transcript_12418/g.17727 Transcript_12418/m.17727 type:complete len:289 (-) Transcript_12418:25-891(-)
MTLDHLLGRRSARETNGVQLLQVTFHSFGHAKPPLDVWDIPQRRTRPFRHDKRLLFLVCLLHGELLHLLALALRTGAGFWCSSRGLFGFGWSSSRSSVSSRSSSSFCHWGVFLLWFASSRSSRSSFSSRSSAQLSREELLCPVSEIVIITHVSDGGLLRVCHAGSIFNFRPQLLGISEGDVAILVEVVRQVEAGPVVLDVVDLLVQAAARALLSDQRIQICPCFLGELVIGQDVGQGGKLRVRYARSIFSLLPEGVGLVVADDAAALLVLFCQVDESLFKCRDLLSHC